MSARIIRVFPRRTNATPDDELVRVATGPGFFDEADEIHVSITFTWDLRFGVNLASQWGAVAPVKIGGPALGERGEVFIPGIYLKHGYVITSRGCPNKCWFCDVWRREGDVRELPIMDGWNILDDNLLACSENHILSVFRMLKNQTKPIQFTGGLEAARLKDWHAEELRKIHPKQVFFAYDTPADLEPLREAGRKMLRAGFTKASKCLRCYVLCGFPHDTIERASRRMRETLDAGFVPMAMLWRGRNGIVSSDWKRFQRLYARPALIAI